MTWFQRTYQRIIASAHKPYMVWLFGFMGFLSASIAPFPLDPLFVVLCLQQPRRIGFFTVSGVLGITLGGAVMYGIGYIFYHTFGENLVLKYGLEKEFNFLQDQISEWGGWILVVKAFTPFPYKILALISGIMSLNFWVFLGTSLLGRALRFGFEGIVLKLYGPKILLLAKKYWLLSVLLFLLLTLFGFFLVKLF